MKLLPVALTVALVAGGCSDKKASTRGQEDRSAAPKRRVDPATVGTIRGVVAFEGPVPENPELPMSEPACKQAGGPPPRKDEVLVTDGKLLNAFVWIKRGLEEYAFEPKKEEVVVDQRGCRYQPLVVGVQVGQPLVFQNSDPLLHNVHTLPEENSSMNVAQPNKGQRHTVEFDAEEVMVKTKCDVHPWMRAYIGVVRHPFFQVTGVDGTFTFEGVPPGEYVIEVWHETLGRREQKVTLGANGSADLTFTFSK